MFFIELENNFKISMETKSILNNQNNLRKKKRAGGTMFPDFRLYNIAMVKKEYDTGINDMDSYI